LKNLAPIRKRKGLSQEQLAKLVGLSRYAIIEYEKCRVSPTLEVSEKIAAVLNVHLNDLNPPSPPPDEPIPVSGAEKDAAAGAKSAA
jgi:transcriptional regulator with XRE-family HTH domain